MRDWNTNVKSKPFLDWRNSLGLKDVMLGSLENKKDIPATYNRGSYPIDTILTTGGVQISSAGYFPFGEGAGDHRP